MRETGFRGCLVACLMLLGLSASAQQFSNFIPAVAEETQSGSIILNWESTQLQSAPTVIRYRQKSSTEWIEQSVSFDSASTSINGIAPDRYYDWAVGFVNDTGGSNWSDTYTFNTLTSNIFKIFFAKGKDEKAEVKWALDYVIADEIKEVVIKYNTNIGEEIGGEDSWQYTEPIPANQYKYKLESLSGAEKYVYVIGVPRRGDLQTALQNEGDMVWSQKGKFKTDRSWGIIKFLVLIGALGVFIYGMKIMSEGLQQAAGSRMRKILSSMTSNRYKGVFSGFLVTALVQSSSATTVMTVSFVNAGLLTLVESAGIMMGANVGTTITGWLVSIFGFKVSIASYALVVIAFGAPLMFLRSSKIKAWANAIIGFAILFMGLGMLKDAVPSLGADSDIVLFFLEYSSIPVVGTLMFVALGALVTIIIQSSSAAMALTMTLLVNGVIPFPVAAAMILGENIGTTITAELASMIANVHAKRSARIHSIFNIVGVTWMVIALPFVLQGIAYFLPTDPFGTDEANRHAATTALALFHSVFNTANVLLLIWFVPQLVKLAIRTVKSKGDADEERHLEYIDAGLMSTPELSVMQAKKEVAKMGELTGRMSKFTQNLLGAKDTKKSNKWLKKIRTYEEITDRIETEISDYLLRISRGELSKRVSGRVQSIFSMSNDIERIADIFFQMSKTIERKQAEKLWFTPEQRANISALFDILDTSLAKMVENLEAPVEGVSIKEAKDIEYDLNNKRNELRKAHLKSIEKGDYNIKSGMVYSDLISLIERVGDHAINVTEAIVDEM